MKVWCCVLIIYLVLSAMNATFANPSSEGSLMGPENESHATMKTSRFSPFKVKQTRDASIVNKAVIAPKSVKLGGSSPAAQKNSSSITGTEIHLRH